MRLFEQIWVASLLLHLKEDILFARVLVQRALLPWSLILVPVLRLIGVLVVFLGLARSLEMLNLAWLVDKVIA